MTSQDDARSVSAELMRLLETSANVQIAGTASRAKELLRDGAQIDDRMRSSVQRIGERFEFYRDSFSPRLLADAETGLSSLYELFDVPRVPRRTIHMNSRIVIPEGSWGAQHDALWESLVPPRGAASTVQGEVVRITGRIREELRDNGGANWDTDYATMVATIPELLRRGTPPSDQLGVQTAVLIASGVTVDVADRLAELTVEWIAANRNPIPLLPPAYRR